MECVLRGREWFPFSDWEINKILSKMKEKKKVKRELRTFEVCLHDHDNWAKIQKDEKKKKKRLLLIKE